MLISFEGLPGAGKTTQSRLLTDRLTRDGLRVAYLPDMATQQPDLLGDELFRLFSSSDDPFKRHSDILTDTYLAAAIRTELVATRIEPALRDHHVVIEDRGVHTMYSYSLATYLQRHRGPPEPVTHWLHVLGAMAGRQADHAVWLRLPVAEASARAAHRDRQQFTPEQQSFLAFVHDAYTELVKGHQTLAAVDVTGIDENQAHTAVYQALLQLGAIPQPATRSLTAPPSSP